MTEKTEGVVLTTVPYNDRTTLVHILTERFGKVTCRVPAVHGRRHAAMRMLLTPMTLADLLLSRSPRQDVYGLSEAHLLLSPLAMATARPDAPLSPVVAQTQCLYLAELLDKTVREEEADAALWRFVRQGLQLLAMPQAGQANFHLIFTTRLSYLLGFRVDMESYAEGKLFDVSEGIFTHGPIYHPYYLQPASATWLYRLLSTDFAHQDTLHLSRAERATLLDMMLTYLRIHLPAMGEVRSARVLQEVFD